MLNSILFVPNIFLFVPFYLKPGEKPVYVHPGNVIVTLKDRRISLDMLKNSLPYHLTNYLIKFIEDNLPEQPEQLNTT